MPHYEDWQHAALLNQFVSNIERSNEPGWYELDMRLTSRQVDQLAAIALIFDALAHAANAPLVPPKKGGD